ncbi:MAG TPA: three-Cys-motif partner protein TcmP [Candidatus Aquicultor sp.]|jgi:three-Cys-motif partner protein
MAELPFKTWPYEDQTKMKHMVFEDYIDKWMKIVGQKNKLNYVDGFGGIGAYQDVNDNLFFGSPVLAAEVAQRATNRLQRKVNIIIIDSDAGNLENIKKIFDHRRISIEPILINDDFDGAINKILDNINNLAPTFVFVDPFGFTLKMKTIERIMRIDKSEILLNFMFTRVNQFLGAPKVEKIFNELFGSTDWQQLKELKGLQRERAIIELYRQQLKKFSKFVYYYRFEFPSAKRTYYYLFHLTNYFKGCVIMKSSFAKFNLGQVEYRGNRFDSNQLTLFNESENRTERAASYMRSEYAGQQKSFQRIVEELIDETEFLESDLRAAVKELEKTDLVKISRIPEKTPKGRARTGIDYNDIIKFQ